MSQPPRPLPAAHRLFPGVFYGWVIAFGTSLLSFVIVGVGFYGMAVFLDGLCSELGWSRTSVSFATSLYFVIAGVAGSLVGRSVDRRGSRVWIAAGSVVMACALLALGRVRRPEELLLVYPLLAVGFAMAGGVPTGALIARWFAARRARALSVAQTGVSVGGVVLVPVMTAAILSAGLEATLRALALLVAGVTLLMTALVLRSSPEPYGLEPDGDASWVEGHPRLDPSRQRRVWSGRRALRTRAFWILVAAFGAILLCQVGTAMHQISILREHMSPRAASLGLSTTAFGSIVARLVVGSFADRVSLRGLGAVLMTIQAAALATFSLATQPWALFAASLVFGCTIGNLFMIQTLIVGELYGAASLGTVLGLLQLLTQTASGLGPYVLGLLFASFGGYAPGLALLAGLALCAAATLSRVRPPPSADVS